MVPAHLSIPLITGRGTGTETCGIDGVFPADDLWISLDVSTDGLTVHPKTPICLCIDIHQLIPSDFRTSETLLWLVDFKMII